MEESNPVQTAGIREFLAETMAEELDMESFHRVGAVVSSSEKSVAEMTALLAEWESFTKSIGVKASTAGVLHGFCALSFGNVEAAEEALKAQKRTEWGAYWIAKAHLAANHPQNALAAAEEGHEKFKDMLPLSYLLAEIYVLLGKTDEAEALLKSLKKSDGASAEYA
ncbi:MAG TPA: tetratricopeptide repeat protein, partial [Planctomycetota bacterium]|nr:tetratricopeptide repeat protein [Planctomycetota bacterium]